MSSKKLKRNDKNQMIRKTVEITPEMNDRIKDLSNMTNISEGNICRFVLTPFFYLDIEDQEELLFSIMSKRRIYEGLEEEEKRKHGEFIEKKIDEFFSNEQKKE